MNLHWRRTFCRCCNSFSLKILLLGGGGGLNLLYHKFSFFVNPLWGHCQEYKIEKNAILQERLLSEKKKHFCQLQPYLVWKFLSHWSRKTNPKVRGTLKSLPKIVSNFIRKNEYIAPKPQRLLFPALHLKFSRSLKNFQASPARQSSLRSKDRLPNHAVV